MATFSFGTPAAAPAAAPKPATFSFGGGGATPSLFGSSTAPAASAAPATTTSLFGAAPATAPSTGLFGASTAPSSGGLFGSTTTTSTAQPSGLFGAGVGQQQQQQQQQTAPQLFGQSQSAATASLFGNSFAPSSAPQPTNAPPIPKLGDPLPPSANEPSIESRLVAIKEAWDPASQTKCRFQTYFYNELPAGQSAAMYSRPVEGARRDEWDRATRENPDPERLIPALALGFPAVQHRLELQQRLNLQHQTLLDQIHAHLDSLSSTHSLTTSLRTLRARQNAVALQARVTRLVAKAGAGLGPMKNASVRRDEDELRVRLEGMKAEVEALKARTGELWAGVGAVKAKRAHGSGDDSDVAAAASWAVADEDGLRQILEILSSQQSGLDHLTRTLQSMAKDVDVVNEAFGLPVGRIVGGSKGTGGDVRFERAVDMIQSLPKSGPIQTTYDQKLQLYSVYKQATEGDIKGSRPGMLDILGRAKWDAWNKCKGLSQLEAERLYVDALIRVLRGYKDRTQAVELLRELELFEIEPAPAQVATAQQPDSGSDSDESSTASYDDRPASRSQPLPRHPAKFPTQRTTTPSTPKTGRGRHAAATPLSPDEVAPPLPGYGPPRTRADPVRYPSSSSSGSTSDSEGPSTRRRRHRRQPREYHPAPASLPAPSHAGRSPAPSLAAVPRPLTASNLRAVSRPASVAPPASVVAPAPPPPGLDAALDRIQTSLTALHERLTLLEGQGSTTAPPRSRWMDLVTRRGPVSGMQAVQTLSGQTRPRPFVVRLLIAILASFRRLAGDLAVVLAIAVLVGRLRGVDVLRLVARRLVLAGRRPGAFLILGF
ncbi:hypothetical protein B0A53_05099 [Rhodotorula sp. CCFEE 5036]|nr:hypothetical protein B0A53_05099 [Rhodotorula sp. CCFEE 5036]